MIETKPAPASFWQRARFAWLEIARPLQTPSPLVAAVFVVGCALPVSRADLWDSTNWALTGTINGATGYDSNLTVSHNGPGDAFFAVNPLLTFSRRDSSTDFHISGGATHYEFVNGRQPNETDLSFDSVYAYPNADNVIPIYRAEAFWLRNSQPDQFLGERVRHETFTTKAEGYLPLTGKLGLRGTANFTDIKFDSVSLNNSYRAEGFVGLAYKRNELYEMSLNLGTALGRSTPNDPARTIDNVHSHEYYITTKLQGQLTDKISGSVYGGFGRANYTGGYTNHNNLPVGGADLTWGLDPRRTLVLAAYSGADYAPDGQTATTTRAFVSYTQVIFSLWQYIIRAGPTHSVYGREVRQGTNDSWDLGMEVAYKPSDRFRIALALTYTKQNSDNFFTQFTREVVNLNATYHF